MDDNIQQTDLQQPHNDSTLDQLQADLTQAMDGWKRTAADFENYRRRKEAENQELVEFAKEVTVAKLLPIIDSLEQALKHLPEYGKGSQNLVPEPVEGPNFDPSTSLRDENLSDDFIQKYENWQNGASGIVKQLDKALEELGVKKIEAKGKKFDPNFHEAVREVEGDEDQVVVDELQTGFELNGKVIRPSQVVISKKVAEGDI